MDRKELRDRARELQGDLDNPHALRDPHYETKRAMETMGALREAVEELTLMEKHLHDAQEALDVYESRAAAASDGTTAAELLCTALGIVETLAQKVGGPLATSVHGDVEFHIGEDD